MPYTDFVYFGRSQTASKVHASWYRCCIIPMSRTSVVPHSFADKCDFLEARFTLEAPEEISSIPRHTPVFRLANDHMVEFASPGGYRTPKNENFTISPRWRYPSRTPQELFRARNTNVIPRAFVFGGCHYTPGRHK